jgi:hypothetical protein
MIKIITITLLTCCCGNAFGHEFYDKKCCDEKHCHPVNCNEITERANGWLWQHDGTKVMFYRHALKKAPDGKCHVCVRYDGWLPNGLCIYLPPEDQA